MAVESHCAFIITGAWVKIVIASPHIPEGTDESWKLILCERFWWRCVFSQGRSFKWFWKSKCYSGQNFSLIFCICKSNSVVLYSLSCPYLFFSSLSNTGSLALTVWLKIFSTGITCMLLDDSKNRWASVLLAARVRNVSPLWTWPCFDLCDYNEMELQNRNEFQTPFTPYRI